MKVRLTIIFFLLISFSFGQRPTNVSGKVIDENGNPVVSAVVSYGDTSSDTAYTDKHGSFKVGYSNRAQYGFVFHFERKGFVPKYIFVDFSSKDLIIDRPIVLRSRKGFWYDPKQIDSADIGITVKEAILKFKLDIDMCILSSEPGKYHQFMTELSDSSYAYFTFRGVYSKEKGVKMTDILDKQITGIGISFIDGSNKIFGDGLAHGNPYLISRRMKINPN